MFKNVDTTAFTFISRLLKYIFVIILTLGNPSARNFEARNFAVVHFAAV